MPKKPKKLKKTSYNKLFLNSGLRAMAVVVLTIGVGAVVLPAIFADSDPAYISSFTATPSNDGKFWRTA